MSNFDHANGRKPEELASVEALEKTNDVDSAEPTIKTDVQMPLHEPKALEEHARASHELIPLRHWQAKNAAGKPMGKAGMANWRDRKSVV